ncbi:54S ribosomal protein L2 mitochondrial [Oleoguttula sp. CCFEE 5521]
MLLTSRSSVRAPSIATLAFLESALSSLRIGTAAPAIDIGRRHASHQAQGRANKAKQGPGKRLGAKKTAGEYVVPGNILFKQRGTHWFPGDNCMMGRDHTIHAAQPGYVRYYRDPDRHPKRKYIGIVFEKEQQLPAPINAVRRRKLGMLAYQIPATSVEEDAGNLTTTYTPSNAEKRSPRSPPSSTTITRGSPNRLQGAAVIQDALSGTATERKATLRPGYQYRQANWEIGRAAERSKAAMAVRTFTPGDRFAAWRKSAMRIAKNAERRQMGRGGKKGAKAKAKN